MTGLQVIEYCSSYALHYHFCALVIHALLRSEYAQRSLFRDRIPIESTLSCTKDKILATTLLSPYALQHIKDDVVIFRILTNLIPADFEYHLVVLYIKFLT